MSTRGYLAATLRLVSDELVDVDVPTRRARIEISVALQFERCDRSGATSEGKQFRSVRLRGPVGRAARRIEHFALEGEDLALRVGQRLLLALLGGARRRRDGLRGSVFGAGSRGNAA